MTEEQEAAMRQALEALESTQQPIYSLAPLHEAITALRRALEQQPADEPVGQLQEEALGRGQVMWFHKPANQSMLYTRPQPAAWVGLTDEEFEKIYLNASTSIEMLKELQAKLREKNGGKE